MGGRKGKRGSKEMSYGKIMTSLLIPKDSRTNPKRILSGLAFLAFVCFFLFAALGKSCQREHVPAQEEQRVSTLTVFPHRS